jgi:hypothetical protein
LLGPEARRETRAASHVTRLVARGSTVSFQLSGVPVGSASVRLWARRDEPRGAWLGETSDALPADLADGVASATYCGDLALHPGPWRVLAQAVDGDGVPTGATSEFAVDVARNAAPIEHTLAPASALLVRGERRHKGDPIAVRPLGWSVDLAAGALGADGRLSLMGLLAEGPHDLLSADAAQRVHTPRAGPPREVQLRAHR